MAMEANPERATRGNTRKGSVAVFLATLSDRWVLLNQTEYSMIYKFIEVKSGRADPEGRFEL